jgi:hypothetical protein
MKTPPPQSMSVFPKGLSIKAGYPLGRPQGVQIVEIIAGDLGGLVGRQSIPEVAFSFRESSLLCADDARLDVPKASETPRADIPLAIPPAVQ